MLHLGAAMTVLCIASSNTDVVVEAEDGRGRSEIPMILWSLLIAPSGSRKSTAAKIPMEMLKRASRSDKAWGAVVLPSEGSIEGWVDFLSEHNRAVLYRTEFSTVLSQSARSYTTGLKPWLMSLYESEDDWDRKTLSGGRVVIERPRLSILGPIPPKTFRDGVDRIDWSTGFLARMTYWLGVRTHRNKLALKDPAKMTKMTQWLQGVPMQSRGIIFVPRDLMLEVDAWLEQHVESKRGKIDEDVFSHLDRYQSMLYVFAAVYAMSRRRTPQDVESGRLVVEKQDVELALRLGETLLYSTLAFFDVSLQGAKGEQGVEDLVHESIVHCPDELGATVESIREDLRLKGYDSISRASLYRVLKSLKDCEEIISFKDIRKSNKLRYMKPKK